MSCALGVLELRLELLQLGRHRADLGDQPLLVVALRAADLLALAVLLGAELLDAGREVAPPLVGLEQSVDGLGEVATREAAAERLGVLADRADVEHR